MPSARLTVWPYSGWPRMLMLTPGSGAPARVSTRPRMTMTRCGSMVPGSTPVWMGLGPLYRKSVALYMLVATPRSSGGASVDGSGGMPGWASSSPR